MDDRRRAFAGDNVGRQLRRRKRTALGAGRAEAVAEPGLRTRDEFSPERWFVQRGWTSFEFQREAWRAICAGESGLIHASTGAGKTYGVWLGALAALAGEWREGLRVAWITPMRALAADTGRALRAPLESAGLGWAVGVRTGDTDMAERARQAERLPQALVTTPESLSVLLARNNAPDLLGGVQIVVVDEWHELLGSKRGVLVQLGLARLLRFNPQLAIWGLSATLGNLEVAAEALFGRSRRGVIIRGREPKQIIVDTLVPATIERFPWGGHLGIRQTDGVVREIEQARSTLVFCNVRSAAELWYQALLGARPDWAGAIALHHGSLDRGVRDWVERGLKDGSLKAVVCTSSLDLGVDFLPVDRVLQIGAVKGVARLLQRAGRSGHAPGRPSRVTIVPTNALELVEAVAVRKGIEAGRIESRRPPWKPVDVLVQHLVTCALGGGFRAEALLEEVRSTYSYRDLTDEEWRWALEFATHGSASLAAYPEYHRIARDDEGVWRVRSAELARRHRLSIGTIVGDATMRVQFVGGKEIGTIEEAFIAMLQPGDRFLFGGRTLELARVHEMIAQVRSAPGVTNAVPRWNGSRMAFSDELADAMLEVLAAAERGIYDDAEMQAVRPLIELQRSWSALPIPGRLVLESIRTREGWHLFCYPFAGRLVHIGLSTLLAWRVSRRSPASFSLSSNDYGFELLCTRPVDWREELAAGLLSPANLVEDVAESLNAAQLAARRFREIARVSGLVFPGYPGQPKSSRQLQASAGLFYEVFRKHDPGNLLLAQAEREALEQELDIARLQRTLDEITAQSVAFVSPRRPTPFAFPLLVGRLREKLSTEKLSDRVARMLAELESAATQ
jgi:ATP-dependent helicase Lhr and Lhr-like helicase